MLSNSIRMKDSHSYKSFSPKSKTLNPILTSCRQFLLVAFALVLSLTGCFGDTPKDKSKAKLVLGKAYPYPGVHLKKQIKKPTVRPNDQKKPKKGKDKKDEKPRFEDDRDNFLVKPKHWTIVQTKGDSKKEDFYGRLTAKFFSSEDSELIGNDYEMLIDRSVNITKDQPKSFAIPVYPTSPSASTLDAALTNVNGFRQADSVTTVRSLLPHQYNMVVFTNNPQTYSFLKVLPTIRNMRYNEARYVFSSANIVDSNFGLAPSKTEDDSGLVEFSDDDIPLYLESMYYRIVFSDWKDRSEVPANVAQWTSTAYLIWGDYDPENLSADQQAAIIDWIHFGGQIIISGEAVDSVRGSFLEDYLPLTVKTIENRPISRLRTMMENWNHLSKAREVPGLTSKEQIGFWIGDLKEKSRYVENSDRLVAERSVGKGRVTVVRFPIRSKILRNWDGLDNWFNHALLNRPGRKFVEDLESPADLKPFPYQWVTANDSEISSHGDPHLSTSLRFASHDWKYTEPSWNHFSDFVQTASEKFDKEPSGEQFENDTQASPIESRSSNRITNLSSDFQESVSRYYQGARGLTPGQWNDDSCFGIAGRKIIADYSGIAPPNRSWVLTSLLVYIAILVPINYLVFRLLGKIEIAWIFVPLIAIGSGIIVVKAASLDIGFSNKMVQVNVLEIPADYNRAHLTGYGSIYTSLSQFFRFKSENPTTIVLPMEIRNRSKSEDNKTVFQYDFSQEPKFGPLQVRSNSTDHFHFQQMVGIGGKFTITQSDEGETQVKNNSLLSLKDCLILWDSEDGVRYAAIKDFAENGTKAIQFQEPDNFFQMTSSWKNTPMDDFSSIMRTVLTAIQSKLKKPLRLLESQHVLDVLRESNPKIAVEVEAQLARKSDQETGNRVTSLILEKAVRRAYFSKEIRLGGLAYQAVQKPLGKGEIRLIGWTDQNLSQLEVQPALTQTNQRTMVVTQLRSTDIPSFEMDKNMALASKKKDATIIGDKEFK